MIITVLIYNKGNLTLGDDTAPSEEINIHIYIGQYANKK